MKQDRNRDAVGVASAVNDGNNAVFIQHDNEIPGLTSDGESPNLAPKWKDGGAEKPGSGNGKGKNKDSGDTTTDPTTDTGDTTTDPTTDTGDTTTDPTTDTGDTTTDPTTDTGGTTTDPTTDTGGTTTDPTTDTGGTTTDPTTGTAPIVNYEQDVSSPAPQYVIDALQAGYKWGGSPVVINYSFLDKLPGYYSSTAPEASNFSAFNAMQEAVVRAVLEQLSSFANVTFVETSDANAWMTFGNTSLGSGTGAWAYYPYQTGSGTHAGDVWVNSDYSFNSSPTEGSFAYLALIHEIGHAMGLQHPALSGYENNRQYTVESYSSHTGMGGTEPTSFMTYDIAALQDLYGANMTATAGDDIYDFTAAHDLIETIWDAGGVDTIDASGRTDSVMINLGAGQFSSIGTYGGGSAASDNIAIAYDVTIENANGGSGNDTIIGNAADNFLNGGGGDDVLEGGAGADLFIFDAGFGHDQITDFEDGLDFIDFRSLGVTSADVVVAEGAGGVTVTVAGDFIDLTGLSLGQIDDADFLFG